MVAPIAPESQCDAGSQKCNMIITLDVKKKTVISVEKDEDTKKE